MKKRFYSKCILAGEHSVLRGYLALAMPFKKYYLEASYKPDDEFQLEVEDSAGNELEDIYDMLLKHAIELLKNKKIQDIRIKTSIKNQIPLSQGLGASAAITLSVAYLIEQAGWINKTEILTFASELENLFHGKSSGVDIACIETGKLILYQKASIKEILKPTRFPLYLSYSGGSASTSSCVKQVQNFYKQDPAKARQVDINMNQAVSLIHEAFQNQDIPTLAKGISLAETCFKDWNLISHQMQDHINWLKDKGALAVKPTGSGRGGYVLSLWSNDKVPSSLTAL